MFICCGKRTHSRRRSSWTASSSAWEMIKAERWAPLLQLLKDPAVELSFRDRKYLSEAPVIEGKLPMLSFMLYRGAPVVILQVFLQRYPASIHTVDSFGRLPLHISCIRQRSCAVIDLLLEQQQPQPNHNNRSSSFASSWASVLVQDRKGNIPLHYAVQSALYEAPLQHQQQQSATTGTTAPSRNNNEQEQERLDVLTSLLVACPHSILVPNTKSQTPLSLAKSLDRHRDGSVVYNMLVRTNKTFNAGVQKQILLQCEDVTVPSSSHFLEPSSTLYMEGGGDEFNNNDFVVDWDNGERQAVGERPQRRNAMVSR